MTPVKEIHLYTWDLTGSSTKAVETPFFNLNVGSRTWRCRLSGARRFRQDKQKWLSHDITLQLILTSGLADKGIEASLIVDVVGLKPISWTCEMKSEVIEKDTTITFSKFRENLSVYSTFQEMSLVVNCRARFFEDVSPRTSLLTKSVEGLALDFGMLLANKKSMDVVLVIGGEELAAHKIILSARSPVFRAMFQHEMKENTQNRVEINDIEKDVFEELLKFIYTGKTEKLQDMASKLLIAAEKYQIEDLKLDCEISLISTIDRDNAIEIFFVADRISAMNLKDASMRYILANASVILASEKYLSYVEAHPNVSLLTDVLKTIAKNLASCACLRVVLKESN